ncbi:MAG: LPS-assembly protein LptD [Myxococcales bacterium]
MRRCAAIAAAVLCAASPPARAQAGSAAGPDPEVELTADRIVYDWETRKLELEGHVVATRGPAMLRATRGSLDRQTGILRLEGGVLAVQGRQVLVAEAAVVDLASRAVDLKDATMFLKDRIAPPPQLLTERKAVRAAGKNALILTGKRVRRLPSGDLLAEDVTMTPCDCAGEPDFELASPEVSIHDDRARLTKPRLGLLGASLPLLVPVSLPLTERQSGLLFPPLQLYSAITGFGTEVPLFLTLGRSYDATVAPGVYTGSIGTSGAAPGSRSVRGPRLGLQLRYAPVQGTAGQIELDSVRDFKAKDSPGGAVFADEVPSSPGRGIDGVRGVLRFQHRSEAPGFLAAAQGTLATDNMYLQDTEARELDRFLDALRTDAGMVRTQGPASAGADATLLFDVRTNNGASPDRRLFGAERRATFQRLPNAFGQLAPARVGPFAFFAEVSAARFAPFTRLDPRERDTGFGPTDLGAGNATPPADPVTDPLGLGRAPAVRFDASPRLSWSASGLPVLLAVELGARGDAWLFENDPARNRQRVYGIAAARAQVSLQRGFGSLLHTIEPGIELRAITHALRSGGPPVGDPFDGGGPGFSSLPLASRQGVAQEPPVVTGPQRLAVPAARRSYDEVDGAAPEAGEALASLRVGQALWSRSSPGHAPARLASLELKQDFVLRAGDAGARIGETGASVGFGWGPAGFGAGAQYDWGLRALTLLSGSASLRDARADEVHATLSLQRGAASERIRGGIDELFAAARVASDPGDLFGSALFGGSFGLPLRRQGLRVSYDATHLLAAGALPADTADWSHRLALVYETPCRCAGIQLYASFPFRGGRLLKEPSIGVFLDLKSLGSFGLSST